MADIVGDFSENETVGGEYLIVGFSPRSISLKQRWRNNGLSADFLADYMATFFPANHSDPNTVCKQQEIKGSVSYVANELLENAMKFNDDSSDYPIKIQLQLFKDRIVFFVTNSISHDKVATFKAYLQELLNSDTQALYIQHLEHSAESDNNTTSGLGFLTMINDYMVKMSWKFEIIQQNPPVITVTTRAQLAV